MSLLQSPTIEFALENCSNSESKHEGDRISSIATLAGVQDFDAFKDDNVEESTMELFKRMGKKGLAVALSATNVYSPPSKAIASIHQHTWLRSLCGPLKTLSSFSVESPYDFLPDSIQCEVLEDGCLELKGPLPCVAVQFNVSPGSSKSEEEESILDLYHLKDPIGDLLRALLNVDEGVLNVNMCPPEGPLPGEEPKYSLPFCTASLRRAGSIGDILIPMANWNNWIDIVVQWPYADALQRNIIGQFVLKQPYAISPTLLEVESDFPSLEQREIQILEEKAKWPTVEHWCSDSGVSFRASLIFPVEVFTFGLENQTLFKRYYPFQAIIVQGDTKAPGKKAKIGCFAATEKLHFLMVHFFIHCNSGGADNPLTIIDNLVIR